MQALLLLWLLPPWMSGPSRPPLTSAALREPVVLPLGDCSSFSTGLPSATPPLLCILYLHPDFPPQTSAFLCLFSETFSDLPWPPNSESSRLQLAFKHLLQFGLNLALHSTLLTSTTWHPSFPGTFILPGERPTVYCTLTVVMLEIRIQSIRSGRDPNYFTPWVPVSLGLWFYVYVSQSWLEKP